MAKTTFGAGKRVGGPGIRDAVPAQRSSHCSQLVIFYCTAIAEKTVQVAEDLKENVGPKLRPPHIGLDVQVLSGG